MSRFENFGSWILDTRSGMVFGMALLLIATGLTIWPIIKSPATVVLSESEFSCVQSEPWGLKTRCTAYARNK